MAIESIDLGQFAALIGLAWILVQMYIAGRKRDRMLADRAAADAVWRNKIEMTIAGMEKNIPTIDAFLAAQEVARKESREDHERLGRHLDEQVEKLERKIDRVSDDARDGRKNLYSKFDHLEERIANLKLGS